MGLLVKTRNCCLSAGRYHFSRITKMCNCSLSKYNIYVEQILVLVLIVGCFLLAEHHLASHKKEQAQVSLKRGVIANNSQDACSARELLFFRPMDINSASFEELTLLPGIGEVTACRVIQYRQSLGFLLSVEELDTINCPLSPKLLGAIAPYLAVEFDF